MRFLLCALLSLGLFCLPSFSQSPQRIISGIPSVTEMLFALGLEDRIVGVTTNCNYPPAALKKEKVGGYTLNLEKVVALKPDLMVMLESAQQPEIEKFRDYGLPVYTINPNSVSGVMRALLELGKVTGREKKAEQIVLAMRQHIDKSQKLYWRQPGNKKKRILAIVGYNPLIVAGGGTFIDDIIRSAGAENLAMQAKTAYPQYSFEQLVKEKPDALIFADRIVRSADLEKDRRWRLLPAVQENRVLFMNADILSRPGPRVVIAIEAIAKFTHE